MHELESIDKKSKLIFTENKIEIIGNLNDCLIYLYMLVSKPPSSRSSGLDH